MRWKLLVLVSLVAALIASGVWCLFIMVVFGHSARPIQTHDSMLLVSTVVPVGMSAITGIFIYRHTSRRRKTQASLAVLITLLFSIAACLAATKLFPQAITIYRGHEKQLRS